MNSTAYIVKFTTKIHTYSFFKTIANQLVSNLVMCKAKNLLK